MACPISNINKLENRVKKLQKETISNEISFQKYQKLIPSFGPIIAISYKKSLGAILDGNSRTCALKKAYDKSIKVEVLFVELTDKEQQIEFNGIIDEIRAQAKFYGFNKEYCSQEIQAD